MSPLGQKVKYRTEQMFSALPPVTDIRRGHRNDKLRSSLCIGRLLPDACFPQSGLLVSLVVRLADGETIELAMTGRDGVFGASTALVGPTALNLAARQ
jgi:hypothetical protein